LATLTNLNNSDEHKIPEDFYTDVVNKVNNEINEFGENNIEYSNLSHVALTRKIAKPSIMTVAYNVSTYGIKQQLASTTKTLLKFNEDIKEDIIDKKKEKLLNNLSEVFKYKKSKNIITYELPSKIKGETILVNAKDLFKISEILNEFIFREYAGLGKVYLFITQLIKITNILGLGLL
jgi:hypothetical protein